MTDPIDATLVTALTIGAGLLGRWILSLHRENKRLSSNERLARQCMRDAMANRDEVFRELCDERRRAYELTLELDAYRKEDARREAIREAGRRWLS